MIRAVIVDDEPLAVRQIRSMLQMAHDFDVVGEAGHGAEAVAVIESLKPDIVFLDIQMPEMNGFEVIEAIGADAMPATVFVTAYDRFAIRAFEVAALDYLLKPYDDLRFARVVERVRRRIGQHGDALKRLIDACPPQRLIVRSRGAVRVIPFDEIDWIGAAGDYAEVHTQGAAFLLDESIRSLAARLPADFSRIHRTAIVRLDRVAAVLPGLHGDGSVRLKDGCELRLSRRYRAGLAAFMAR